ncbi:MAG: urate hydroxylase PuuD [Acidobacteriia bacterium]|nr:urate hydroxylase PuuD [Terriglobia bacterium]
MAHMIWGSLVSFWMVIQFPDNAMAWQEIFLRWFHFLAGITWIGMLYFFNLVNVNLMKALDAPTKGKVIPQLMPRALFWFRWGAVVTVFIGIWYYMIILSRESSVGRIFGTWLAVVIVAWLLIFLILRPVSGALNNGNLIALLVAILMFLLTWCVLHFNATPDSSNRALSIGVGGGMGVIMLLNVWGIIWPHQKRIIAWTKANAESGTPIPPESAKLARRAFLASRMNFWLSIPMLFFMAAASHFPFLGK